MNAVQELLAILSFAHTAVTNDEAYKLVWEAGMKEREKFFPGRKAETPEKARENIHNMIDVWLETIGWPVGKAEKE